MLVHELIFRGESNKIALCEKNKKYSYAEMQNKVAAYRSYLYARGVREKDNVALFAKNSAEFVFAYMSIASLGGVVVPLNTMLTSREISFILEDAKVKHIVADRELQTAGEHIRISVSTLDKESGNPALSKIPPAQVSGRDPCVILYTSGTTGRPKGALLSHDNLVSNARAFSGVTQTSAGDNVLCVLPMFHSFAWTCCVTTALYNGASITVVETFSPKEVIATIRETGITVVMGVPAMYGFYSSLAAPGDLAGVRLFASGGASLPLEILNKFYEKTGKRVVEGYGLSEASPAVSFNPLNATKPGSVGLPVPGVKVRIVDDHGRELEPGEIGELLVQGPNVMLGYYGLPEESAEALRGGWLHTGDLAYMDEDGYIFIVDRKKDMIIVSGLNVYPREVEEALYQHPSVKETAVVGVPDKKRGETVRAFVVIKEGFELNKKELMTFLKTNLAAFKLPRDIIELESLPKNATGKILKKELRKLCAV
ncbi:MAG TPA: long-chain fatty acid--CoA ligase [Bacillota bacterium]|nr:long-chain fatty acid--CoA ligase [Bacillota bacterium]